MIWRGTTWFLGLLLGATLAMNFLIEREFSRLDSYRESRGAMCRTAEDKDACFRALATHFSSPALCRGAPLCLATVAASLEQPDACDSAEDAAKCYEEYVNLMEGDDACSEMSEGSLGRAKCEDASRKLKQEGDVERDSCAGLQSEQKAACLKQRAVERLDVSLCRELSVKDRDDCLFRLAPDLSAVQAPRACGDIEDPQLSYDCELVLAKRDPARCSNLGGRSETCFRSLQHIPISACERVRDEDRDLCVNQAAFLAQRPDYCSRLKGEQKISPCLAIASRTKEECKVLGGALREACLAGLEN